MEERPLVREADSDAGLNRRPTEPRLGSGTAYGLISQLLGIGTSFVMGILVARLLGPDGKGMLSVVMQVIGIAAIVFNLGVSGANVYFLAKERIAPGIVVGNSLLLALVCGAVAVPFVYVLLVGPLAVVDGVTLFAVVVAMVSVPLSLLASWLSGVSSGLGDLRTPVLYSIVSSVVTLGVVAGLLVFRHVGIAQVVTASALGTLTGLVALFYGFRAMIGRVRVDVGAARQMVGYSARSYLAGIAGQLHSRQDVLILGWMAGASAVGLYSVGVSLSELIQYVPIALGGVLLAKTPRVSKASALELVCRSTRISVMIMIAIAVPAALLVPLAVRLLYGQEFSASVAIFYVLLPGMFAGGVVRTVWNYHAARNRIYWRESLVMAGVNIGLNTALIPHFGALGAGAASTLSYGMLATLLVWRLVEAESVGLRELLVPTVADAVAVFRGISQIVGSGKTSK